MNYTQAQIEKLLIERTLLIRQAKQIDKELGQAERDTPEVFNRAAHKHYIEQGAAK